MGNISNQDYKEFAYHCFLFMHVYYFHLPTNFNISIANNNGVRANHNYCMPLQNILERLNKGEVILGEGSYVLTLENRGVVRAGDWTPEAVCEYPDTIKQLSCEYARAGSDVTQTFTFWSTDDKLNCDFTVIQVGISMITHDIKLGLFLSSVSKSTRLPVTLPRRLPRRREQCWQEE